MVEENERTLEARMIAFLSRFEGAENIDEQISEDALSKGKRADFLLDERRIVLELKTLKANPAGKIDERLSVHRNRPDFPVFCGKVDLNRVLAPLHDGEKIRHEIFHAVTRSVQTALEKADDQIGATKKALGLQGATGLVVILNEGVAILPPDHIAAKASQFLLKKRDGEIRYQNIGYVLIVSESHTVTGLGGSRTSPLLLLSGPYAQEADPAQTELSRLMREWAASEWAPFIDMGQVEHLDDVDFQARSTPQTEEAKRPPVRHEVWREQYRAKPYLRDLSEEQFIDHVLRLLATLTRQMEQPFSGPPNAETADLMEKWTHALEEAEYRALDMRKVHERWAKTR